MRYKCFSFIQQFIVSGTINVNNDDSANVLINFISLSAFVESGLCWTYLICPFKEKSFNV